MPRSASGDRCSSTSSEKALVNVPSANGSLPQIAEQQIDARARLRGEERADVDADRRRAPVAVPQQRPAAAAAEIDDEVVRLRREERAQHVVADLRSEQRRRDPLVARVGVQRLVQVLGLLGELDRGPQIEVVAADAL